jgi:glyoxylase-like metal-dependent hydrolase (beta-lactamase superfamily II)
VEIVRGVHSISTGTSPFIGFPPPNVYLVLGREEAVFIDSGYRNEDDIRLCLDYMAEVGGPPVTQVILTHRHLDHIGGAAHFHRATGAGLLSSLVEKPFIEAAFTDEGKPKIHEVVEDGETLDLGGVILEFIHAPGHTLGSVAVYAPQTQILFTGDTVLGRGSVSINPVDGDMTLYVQSLRRLMNLDLELICPGHGPVVHDPQEKLKEQVNHRLRREIEVVQALRESERTLDGLFYHLYPKIKPQLERFGRNQVHAHLIKLVQDGCVQMEGEFYHFVG